MTPANKKDIIASSKNLLVVSTCLPNNMRSGLNADFLDQHGAYSIVCITIRSNHGSSCKIPEDSDWLVDSTFLPNFFPKRFFKVPGVEVVDGFWSNSGLAAEASALVGIKFLREEMRVTTTLKNQASSTRRDVIDASMTESTQHHLQMSLKAYMSSKGPFYMVTCDVLSACNLRGWILYGFCTKRYWSQT